MAKLSRTLKYQDLRDKIDEETSITPIPSEPVSEKQTVTEPGKPSHANKPLHPHEEVRVKPNTLSNTGRNPLMDGVLDEVKQYNIEKGTRYSTDTQINILKQFEDGNFQKRNQHIMPMEEETESAGSTMQIPVSQSEEGIPAYLPNQRLTRMNPITLEEKEEPEVQPVPEKEPEADEDTIETPKIESHVAPVFNEDTAEMEEIDTASIIHEKFMPEIKADEQADTDKLTVTSPSAGSFISYSDEVKFMDEEEEEIDYSRPRKTKHKKTKIRSEKPIDTSDMPSAKIRMVASDVETVEHQPRSKGSVIVNTLLVVMILLLIAAIGFVIYLFKSMLG